MPDRYVLTEDRAAIPVEAALRLLVQTYWAKNMSAEQLARAMDNSMCFGVLKGAELVGFARVITDRATFAYLTDVVIADAERGQGLGLRLMEHIVAHPELQGLRRFALLTADAMGLYEKLGFRRGAGTLTYMERAG